MMYSLIIVDYCSLSKTLEYITLFHNQSVNSEIIVPIIVDNSPNTQIDTILQHGYKEEKRIEVCDKEVIFFSNDTQQVLYCFSGENLGYAKGNNLGTRISDELFDTNYYIISNNDLQLITKFDGEVFSNLFTDYPDVAVIGPKVIGRDGKPQSPHKKVSAFVRLIAYYWFSRWPFHWKPDYDYDGHSKYCYRVMGSFMVINPTWFRKAERFDENTFMFCEEPILSERLERIGGKTYFYNDWTIIHAHGETIKKANKMVQAEQWAFDSCCYYFREYFRTSQILIGFARVNFKIYKCMITILAKLRGKQ